MNNFSQVYERIKYFDVLAVALHIRGPTTKRRNPLTRTTGIEWTEHTWNPFVGCSVHSAGCKNCYAMAMANRLAAFGQAAYQGATKRTKAGAVWTGNIARNTDSVVSKPARLKPGMIFVNSMSDFWHPNADDAWRVEALRVMSSNDQHIYQILTKRPECISPTMKRIGMRRVPDHIWIGTTIEDDRVIDRLDHLKKVPATTRFVSFEPLIGDVGDLDLSDIHWAITGGESGPRCRPCEADWVRKIRDMCIRDGVAFFHKQWGHWANNPIKLRCPSSEKPRDFVKRIDPVGKGGSMIDGRRWNDFPASAAHIQEPQQSAA